MRPLDPLTSIKMKLGAVIVAAVGVTTVAVALGLKAGLPLIVCAVGAGGLALAMVQFLARGMTSPLREMAAAAASMARGDYDRRVTATSRDEVGELARAFNRMAGELAEADRMRRDLVANVSHELRTPISALQAVLENIVDGVEEPDDDTLKTMLGQVERLGKLVSQLLDLSKLESGAVPIQWKKFHVGPVLDQAVKESLFHAKQATRGDVDVTVQIDPAGLEMDADPERMHQVIMNVVDNAVRHSPDRGTVVVRARRNGAGVAIEIIDEGPGIPPAEASRVFDRFYRSDEARSSMDGGSGLGLAIARWIIELHGGEIRVEQAQPSGCRIVISLPSPRA